MVHVADGNAGVPFSARLLVSDEARFVLLRTKEISFFAAMDDGAELGADAVAARGSVYIYAPVAPFVVPSKLPVAAPSPFSFIYLCFLWGAFPIKSKIR